MARKLAEVTADGDRTAVVGRLDQGTARMRAIVEALNQRKAVDRARAMGMIDKLSTNMQQMDDATVEHIATEVQKAPRSRRA